MLWTTTNFLASVQQRGQFPDTSNTKNITSPANMLVLATEELRIHLLPELIAARAEFYVREADISLVANQASYPLSTRAVGGMLRSIKYLVNGQEQSFRHIDKDQWPVSNTAGVYGYCFENNNIVVLDTPSSADGTLRTRYFIRPSRLEQVANCALVSAINTSTGIVTVTSTPGSWGAGTVVDWVSKVAPYAHRAIDLSLSNVSGTDLTFAVADLPSDAAVGDYICLAEYTCLPQIPEDWQPILVQRTVCAVHEALGNIPAMQAAMATLKQMQDRGMKLITPRDESHPKKIISNSWGKNNFAGRYTPRGII